MIKKLFNFICKKKVVAVIRLKGVISPGFSGFSQSGALSLESIKKDIDRAFEYSGLLGVVLAINSPGGSAVQAELIYKYIRSLSHKTNIPTYSFIEDVAASGGYFLACASDEIYVSESSIVGSIGVITAGFGFTQAMKKLGLERRIITQGANKSIYDPFLPVKDMDKKIIEAVQKDVYECFKRHVISRRGARLSKDHKRLFSGQFWSGRAGLALGLVDGIGNFYEVMEAKYGQDIVYKFIEKRESWISRQLRGVVSSTPTVNEIIMQVKELLHFNRFQL